MTARTASPPIPRVVILLGALIPLAAAFAATARAVTTTTDSYARKAAVESTYLRRDSFALIHQRDSINASAVLNRIDTSLNQLTRACRRRRECP